MFQTTTRPFRHPSRADGHHPHTPTRTNPIDCLINSPPSAPLQIRHLFLDDNRIGANAGKALLTIFRTLTKNADGDPSKITCSLDGNSFDAAFMASLNGKAWTQDAAVGCSLRLVRVRKISFSRKPSALLTPA